MDHIYCFELESVNSNKYTYLEWGRNKFNITEAWFISTLLYCYHI